MKKVISVFLSAMIGLSALCTAAYAAEPFPESNADSIAVFGDSIAAGYGLSQSEYTYGEICADYLGLQLDSFANSGDTTADLYELLSSDPGAIQAASEAEVIVVSIGANDMVNSAVKYILDYAADNDLLAAGKTAEDIPENPTRVDAETLLDQDALQKHLLDDPLKATRLSTKIKQYLIGTSSAPTGTLQKEIIPDTEAVIEKLQSLNPDADIIIQTVYHPMQFSQEYWNNTVLKKTSNEVLAVKLCRNVLIDILNAYKNNITELSTTYNIKTADIYSEFTSIPLDAQTVDNQGYSYYFINSQLSGDNRDVHPNQRGHLAIAAAVLEQIGQLHDTETTSLLRQLFASSVTNPDEYPSAAYETYLTVAGKEIQPVVTTTTTTAVTTTTVSSTTTSITTTTSEVAVSSTTTSSTITSTTTTTKSNITTTSTAPSTTTTTPVTTTPMETYNFGDVNSDGAIDALDASVILMEYSAIATNATPILSAEGRIAADVNRDNTVDALDASVVLIYYSYKATGGTLSLDDFLSQ